MVGGIRSYLQLSTVAINSTALQRPTSDRSCFLWSLPDLIGILSEHLFYGLCFHNIIDLSASAVGIDIIHLLRFYSGIFQGKSKGLSSTPSFGFRLNDMIAITCCPITDQLGINICSPLLSMI